MSKKIALVILWTSFWLAVITLIKQLYDARFGSPHICTAQYIASTVGFIITTIVSLLISRRYPVTAVFLWSWGAILSMSVSGVAYSLLDDGDDYPTVLYTLYLVILCAGTVMGFWRTLPTVIASCSTMAYTGWMRGRGDQATPAIIILAGFFIAASWFNHLFRENADLKRYVDMEIDGAKAKLQQRRDADMGEAS